MGLIPRPSESHQTLSKYSQFGDLFVSKGTNILLFVFRALLSSSLCLIIDIEFNVLQSANSKSYILSIDYN